MTHNNEEIPKKLKKESELEEMEKEQKRKRASSGMKEDPREEGSRVLKKSVESFIELLSWS